MKTSWHNRERPSAALSVGIGLLAVGLMAHLTLYVFWDRYVALTYALPLLICLWHRDRRLLWSMSAAFSIMAGYEAFILMPQSPDFYNELQWGMEVANILVVASVVHKVLNLTERLKDANLELHNANIVLADRNQEITRQNGELQAQAEELAQQNEEIQVQSEELAQQNEETQQQAEELQVQSEELHSLNAELSQRETMLANLLQALRGTGEEEALLEQICQALLALFQANASAAAVVERCGDELVIRAQTGVQRLQDSPWPLDRSFASVAMEHGRTAFIEDLSARPDLLLPDGGTHSIRSILASPFKIGGEYAGAVEIYASVPHKWTTEHFRMAEWVASQCSLVLELRRVQRELQESNLRLESLVQERTAKLQEMVAELEHFSYSITHDMRAPLRAMQSFAEMLAEECGPYLDGERGEYLRRIRTAASRMDRLITDCLSYSKAVRQQMELTPVEPAKLLSEIIESYPNLSAATCAAEYRPRVAQGARQ
jgi:predicted nuclease with TOPRIM domain